jgi:cytidine deaminase
MDSLDFWMPPLYYDTQNFWNPNMHIRFFIPLFLLVRTILQGDLAWNETLKTNPFVIEKEKVDQILLEEGISVQELLHKLIPIAKPYARPPISNYRVGAAALGKSGNIYLGVNLEFAHFPLNEAVHGEQFLIVNARNHGEKELIAIALSAAPCGHCRQFLNEIGVDLLILTPGSKERTLSSLLPESFGPQDLGLKGALMDKEDNIPAFEEESPIYAMALQAAHNSYAPYSSSKSGVAIETKDGSIYTGSYLENVAFNPSLSPLQAALVALVIDKIEYNEIKNVVLAEQIEPQNSCYESRLTRPHNMSYKFTLRELVASLDLDLDLDLSFHTFRKRLSMHTQEN